MLSPDEAVTFIRNQEIKEFTKLFLECLDKDANGKVLTRAELKVLGKAALRVLPALARFVRDIWD